VSALYEPLIERDLEAIPAAVRAFLETHSAEELWVSIARFAVLAYAPSQHAKRAVMAARAAHDLREVMGERWTELLIECARYAAASRQPWSEPPMLDPPQVEPGQPRDAAELRAAIEAKDRPRAERWLAARVDDADDDLRALARGDARLLTDAVLALAPLLGDKGRYALLRIAIWEMLNDNSEENPKEPLETLIANAVTEKASPDSVRKVLVANVPRPPSPVHPIEPYRLARDYAQTLLVHAAGLPEPLLAAVRENLEKGESFEDWTLA
jgi:hypothetical protein